MIFVLLALAMMAIPLGEAHAAATTSTLTVTSQNSSGATLTGYYTALSSGGNVVATGYTPASYTLNDGQSYTLGADGYGNCNFDHWADTGSTDPMRAITISSDMQITAVYNCGGAGGGSSSVTVDSIDTNNNPLVGYYTVLLSSSGTVLTTGFTPATFGSTTAGTSYNIEVGNYGNCNFEKWSDGVMSNPRPFIATSSGLTFTAIYNCGGGGGGGSSVSVNSVDTNNNPISGYHAALLDSGGNTLSSGFTPVTFATTASTAYEVQAGSFGSCNFLRWSDGVVNNPRSFTATSAGLSLTAVYNCGGNTGGGGGGEKGAGPGTITIYDHRIPASYWADCFASSCTNPLASCDTNCIGPGASMWVVLYNAAGTVVATGFSNEGGLTFTGLNPTTTYYLYPADCDQCHGSTHDVLFSHWGTNNSTTTRPLPLSANGTFVDAWYTCTNGCTGV